MTNLKVTIILFLMICTSITLVGANRTIQSDTSKNKVSIEQLIDDQGRLAKDRNKSGAIDLSGYELGIDDSGAPVFFPAQSAMANDACNDWDQFGGLREGVNGDVNAIAVDVNDNVYVGGDFTIAGDKIVNNIAKWDGTAWHALGSGKDVGVSGSVSALEIDKDGNVIIGGSFVRAGTSSGGGTQLGYIAKYNVSTNSWEPFVQSTGGSPGLRRSAVADITFDKHNNIYLGGTFISSNGIVLNRVAKWNVSDSTWQALGKDGGDIGIASGLVYAIAVDTNDVVYAGGSFSSAGGISTNYIAKWNPLDSLWDSIGMNGVSSTVREFLYDSLTHEIYVGGQFRMVDGISARGVAKLELSTETWSDIGSSTESIEAFTLRRNNLGELYAGLNSGINQIRKWDGTAWNNVATLNSAVNSFGFSSTGEIYAGGKFSASGSTALSKVGLWDGSAWQQVGAGSDNGANDEISTMVIDTLGDVYIGGQFTSVGGKQTLRIARWNGTEWFPVGAGFLSGSVSALDIDPATNQIYIGGSFSNFNGVFSKNVVIWDPSSSTAIPIGESASSSVENLAVVSGSLVYSSLRIGELRKWDGTAWSSLGFPTHTSATSITRDIEEDTLGNLYITGRFDAISGVAAENIAYWNDITTTWHPLAEGLTAVSGPTEGTGLAVDDNNVLYVGGGFLFAGLQSANKLAKWDPSGGGTWAAVAPGVDINGFVNSVTIDTIGKLIIGGNFRTIGLDTFNNVARWDGTAFSTLGTAPNIGTNAIVFDVTNDKKGTVYMSGDFSLAGGEISSYFTSYILKGDPEAICLDTTLILDASGMATITPAMIGGGSSTVCGLQSLMLDIDSFDCDDIVAPVSVTLTVTDLTNKIATCTSIITVVDTLKPIAICRDTTVYLEASGMATITPALIDNGSITNCGTPLLSLDIDSFDCDDLLAPIQVMLRVTDLDSDTTTCISNITVIDTIEPTITIRDTTLYLDNNGEVSITAAAIGAGTSDNCSIDEMTVDQTTFTCADGMSKKVYLTVNDFSDNIKIDSATITILDPFGKCCPSILNVDTDPIIDGTYTAVDTIHSNTTISTTGNIIFQSADVIRLDTSFNVQTGGVLEAVIGDCN